MRTFIKKAIKPINSILGVTLLEIMLVLAIAAMIIVMSIRYYQTAAASQQTNAALEQIQAVMAAVDGISQATGSYILPVVVTGDVIKPLLPANGLTAPWGGDITVKGTAANTYTIGIAGVPSQVCPLLLSKLNTNAHLSTSSTCATGAATALSYTYNSQGG